MERRKLGRVLDHAVHCALLSGAASCGGSAVEQGTNALSPPFSFAGALEADGGEVSVPREIGAARELCAGSGTSRLAGAKLAGNYDFVSLRTATYLGGAPAAGDGHEADAVGEPCHGASDVAACRATLANVWPTSESAWSRSGQAGTSVSGFVTTRADEVRLHQALDEILGVLGELDAAPEAVLWVEANGYTPHCEEDALFKLPLLELQESGGGYRLNTSEMINSCPIEYENVILDVARDGRIQEVSRTDHVNPSSVSACVGRRPPGLAALRAADAEVGAFFAQVAALELAAVKAFEWIEGALDRFGAPRELRALARAAGEDEVRHAHLCAELARRYGYEPELPEIAQQHAPSLLQFAVDNVVEGCIRETFGAAVAQYQAATARDASVRAALAGIAQDERRHAELSLQIHEWLIPRLTQVERVELERAAHQAIRELRSELEAEVPLAVQEIAGMPGAARARVLLDRLEAELWSQSRAA